MSHQLTLDGVPVSDLPQVRTADGHMVVFDRRKITDQLVQETRLVEMFYDAPPMDRETAGEIALEAENRLRKMDLSILSGSLIREVVNIILLERGMDQYRRVSSRVGTPVYDAHLIDVGKGFGKNDNANLQENAETSHKKKADKISKEQYLLQMPPHLADYHNRGDIHIHDLEYFGSRSFCMDWDLRYFFYYGLMPDGNGTKASVAGPAMRAEVAVLHAVKALGAAQTNFAGGQGYYNFLTFLAPYCQGVPYKEVKQLMQMFVYEMTQMMVARGGQIVFSSVQLSPGVPKIWRDKPVVYKGKIWDGTNGTTYLTYGMFEQEVRWLFKAMMEVMLEGDAWGKPFSFPKPEISIEQDFMGPEYRDLYLMAFDLASKYGTPYFDNQLPEYRGAGGEGISCYQCCAYQFSKDATTDANFADKMMFQGGAHFSMGSWQVVTMNCPRAAYKSGKDLTVLLAELRQMMNTAVEIFLIKRKWMNAIRAANRMPFVTMRPKDPNTGKRGAVAVDLDGLVYTIGVIGLNEVVQHMTGHQMHEDLAAYRMAVRVMGELVVYANELSEKNGITIALARTPAETTGQRFATADLLNQQFRYDAMAVVKGDLKTALDNLDRSRDLPIYYTNGTMLAPSAGVTLSDRLRHEHVFFPIVDGGNIFHIWLGERRPDPAGMMDMAFRLCQETQVGYFAFTRDLTVCLQEFTET